MGAAPTVNSVPTGPAAAIQTLTPNADVQTQALLARLAFEKLDIQLVGVASFGGETACFIKSPDAAAPRSYKTGDVIEGFRIVSINPDAIGFEQDGASFTIELGTPEDDLSLELGNRPVPTPTIAQPAIVLEEGIDVNTIAAVEIKQAQAHKLLEGQPLSTPERSIPSEEPQIRVAQADAPADYDVADAGGDIAVKSGNAPLKIKTDSYKTASVVEDAWNVPGLALSRYHSGSSFIWPMQGRITSGFGYRRNPMGGGYRNHSGIDIASPYGTTVRASAAGVVVSSSYSSTYGRNILIRHSNGFETRYGHLSSQLVRAGERVEAGEAIGREGSTGRSTGPHLHFEIIKDGRAINPLPYLEK